MKKSPIPIAALLVIAQTMAGSTTNPTSGAAAPSELVILVSGLRNARGLLNVALFDQPDGFPSDSDRAAHRVTVDLQGSPSPPGDIEVRVPDVSAGSFAVLVLHDENSNLRMDRNFVGMPREGYGVSNNARNRFGPPDFERARVTLALDAPSLQIRVEY